MLAERGSFSRAGNALNVTHAAISQQIKALESWVGVKLVERIGRCATLTGDGRALARDLSLGFEAIQRGVGQLRNDGRQDTVQVTMSPAFAMRWMMPRIMDFQNRHPEITIMLNPTAEVVELVPGGIDLAVRYADRRRGEPDVETLLVADMVVVGTPALISGSDISNPAALVHLPWLQELVTNEVADWFTRHGVDPVRPPMITHMPGNLIMEAVRRGDGLTYTAQPWVAAALRSGGLVELFTDPGFGIYYIQTRPGEVRRPVRTFVTWLKSQAEADIEII